jgi:hypothetical protein
MFMRRFPPLALAWLVAACLLAACDGDPAADLADDRVISAGSTPSRSEAPTNPSGGASVSLASPTPPALPARPPRTRGAPSATCVEGWSTPPADSSEFTDPLGIVRRTTGVDAAFEVVDMRMFVGPESPPSEGPTGKGYLQDIVRWYIKLYAPDDLSFQGRFLVEQRRFGRGLAAVAPFDTEGFRSPDWRGFQYDSTDDEPRVVSGLPGRWTGVEYDFVEGGAGLEIPGLPAEVAGCLDGT